jgi:hypothetical protein|tara:strand:- start:406 stop:777 length:372 start_codon:yes stop_codon:yes gene_type:complete
MPYYQCPKCSGRDTYEGTELVSGSKGGGAIIGPENALGMSPVIKTGGKKTIDQVTVVKCKKCDILLGDKDLHLTPEELVRIKEEEEHYKIIENRNTHFLKVFCWILIIISFICGLAIWINILL